LRKLVGLLVVVFLLLGISQSGICHRGKSRAENLKVKFKYHIIHNKNALTAEGKKVGKYPYKIGASNNLSLGSKVTIPGFGTYVCRDRMNRHFRSLKQTHFEPYFLKHEKEKIKKFEKEFNNQIESVSVTRK
jgi:hypothetical protein